MTIEEMHGSILLKIDKMGSYSTANLIPGEIDDFINQAQRNFVNQYRPLLREYSQIPQGVEAHENLRTLVEEESITPSSASDLEKGFSVNLQNTLANTYDYFISARAYFSTPDYWKPTRIVNKTFINDRSTARYHEHPIYSETPVHIDNQELIGLHDTEDSEIPSKILVTYLRKFQDVDLNPNNPSNSVDSELPEDTHRDLVDIASQKIIASLAGQRQQRQQEQQE